MGSSYSIDYEKSPQLQQKIQSDLEGILEISTSLDEAVANGINVRTGALCSKNRGLRLWNSWVDGAAPYKDLYGKMKNINVATNRIHNVYAEADKGTATRFGASLDEQNIFVQESDKAKEQYEMTIDNMREEALLRVGATEMDGNPIIDINPGGTSRRTINGTEYEATFDDDGKMIKLLARAEGSDGNFLYVPLNLEGSMEDDISKMLAKVRNDADYDRIMERIYIKYGEEGCIIADDIFGSAALNGMQGAAGEVVNGASGGFEESSPQSYGETIGIPLDTSEKHSNSEYKAAGREMLDSASALANELYAGQQQVDKLYETFAFQSSNSELFNSLSDKDKIQLLNDLKSLECYGEIAQDIQVECNKDFWADDGAFGDFDSVLVGGLFGSPKDAYEKAVSTANDLNERLNNMPMTIDEFYEKYGDIIEDIESAPRVEEVVC